MARVVFIPGLGADERLFSLLELDGINADYISFQKPGTSRSFKEYVQQLQGQLKISSEPVILIGVSLGGIMAMEWRSYFPVKKTILISSIKCSAEFPGYLRIFKTGNAYKIIKPGWLKKGAKIVKPFISDMSHTKSIDLFRDMLADADDEFISWGIGQVLNWSSTDYNKSDLIHIHGNKDHLFPIKKIISPDYIINGGAHDMVMSKAKEISIILRKELSGV